jgi:hypothetical protein
MNIYQVKCVVTMKDGASIVHDANVVASSVRGACDLGEGASLLAFQGSISSEVYSCVCACKADAIEPHPFEIKSAQVVAWPSTEGNA